MINLLKLLGKGLIYIILLPLGVVFFAIYGIVLLVVWIVYFFKTIINYFRGKSTGLTLPEDIKAIEILNNSRDFSQPVPQNTTPGVTFNFNVNGKNVASQNGQVTQNQLSHENIIDLTHEDEPKKIEGDK